MPYASHDPLITRQELFSHLGDTHWVVVDCRWSLAHPTLAHQAYQHAHIPGAWFMDMEVDLSGPKGTHGGRHPLPSADHWSSLMQRIGVGTSTNVVAYDEDGVGASRFWWLMNYFGHHHTYVLQGGIAQWQQHGLPVTSQLPHAIEPAAPWNPTPDPDMIVGREDILHWMSEGHLPMMLDARDPDRYAGKTEPLDPLPGHIPGARNLPWYQTVQKPSQFIDRNTLQETLHTPLRSESLHGAIVYCGSGVSACVNALALHRLGYVARLYPGSWSDWTSYPNPPISPTVAD